MSEKYFAKKINLRPVEQIIVVLHHHPITYFKQFAITAILILGAFFLMFKLFNLGSIGVALFLAILFTGLFYGGREFYIWYFNAFIITSQRIIDIDQRGFFNKTVSEVSCEKILDISYSVKGFWQTILKLGTIKIQASGASLLLQNIKDVSKVNQLLVDLIRQQTGKKIEVKEEQDLSSQQKEKIVNDFLNQEELAEFEDYKLDELVEEFKDTFGELKLKKILVDELEKQDQKQGKQGAEDSLEGKKERNEANFKKKII